MGLLGLSRKETWALGTFKLVHAPETAKIMCEPIFTEDK